MKLAMINMRKLRMAIPLTLVVLLSLGVLSHFTFSVEAETSKGSITFEPNMIPFTTVYKEVNKTSNVEGSGERFRFEWNNPLDTDEPNRFDIELFFNATIYKKLDGVWQNVTKLWSLRDFEDDFDVSVDYQAVQNESCVQFGWLLENPEDANEWVHNAWFKIEDTQPFDYEDIWIIEGLGENETSDFHLPDNLVLSFKDLEHKGFVIGSQNKTSMSVKGFSGKSSWDLDPITYSDPTITVTDNLSSNANWYVWNASNVNGWGAVFNYDNMTYFYNSSKLVITSGGTFVDKDVHMVFNTTSETAIFNDGSTFQLGTLEDSVNKVTSGGVSVLFDLAGGANDIAYYADAGSTTKFYGGIFSSISHQSSMYVYHSSAYVYVYNTNFVGMTFRIYYPHADFYRVTQTSQTLGSGTGLYNPYSADMALDDILIEGNENALFGYVGTIENLVARNNTYIIYCYSVAHPNAYLINPDVDVWNVRLISGYVNEVYRQYTFDLTVTYPNGTAIQNANVTVTHYGQAETEDFTELTDASGQIAQKTLTMGFYNQTGANTIYSYNDYNLQITNVSGYQDYNGNFTLDDKTDWTITLTETTTTSRNFTRKITQTITPKTSVDTTYRKTQYEYNINGTVELETQLETVYSTEEAAQAVSLGASWRPDWIKVLLKEDVKTESLKIFSSPTLLNLLLNKIPVTAEYRIVNKQSSSWKVTIKISLAEILNSDTIQIIDSETIEYNLSSNEALTRKYTLNAPAWQTSTDRKYVFMMHLEYDGQETKKIVQFTQVNISNLYHQIALIITIPLIIVVVVVTYKKLKKKKETKRKEARRSVTRRPSAERRESVRRIW